MRIGVIYLGRRGIGAATLQLAKALSLKTDTFVVISQNSDIWNAWREAGIPMLDVPTFQSYYGAFASCLNRPRLRSLADRIRAYKPDVLLTYMVHPWTPFLQRYLRDIPQVVTIHDPTAHPGIIHSLSSSWEALSARRATRTVIMSSLFIGDMRKKGVPEKQIDVIPLGTFCDSPPTKSNGVGNPGSLLFFGRITAYKGLEVLLRAFLDLSSRFPEVTLEIAGDGDITPYASLLSQSDRIRVTNRWVSEDEVSGFFSRAGMVVLPYTSATQSGVITLAAAFGLPVIATKTGALPDQIKDGRTGLLVEPGSSAQLAQAIETLLRDRGLAGQLGRRLAEDFAENCSWEKISDLFLDSCSRALSSFKARTS